MSAAVRRTTSFRPDNTAHSGRYPRRPAAGDSATTVNNGLCARARARVWRQVMLVVMCGVGGMVFRYTEGAFETFYKCGVKRVKRDFLDGLWTDSRRMAEDQWKRTARRRLVEFEEQLHDAFEAGTTTYSGRSSWSFVNSAIYCFTVVTTIGKKPGVPVVGTVHPARPADVGTAMRLLLRPTPVAFAPNRAR